MLIDTELVRKYLNSLVPIKGSRPDGKHPVFLRIALVFYVIRQVKYSEFIVFWHFPTGMEKLICYIL